MNTLSHRRNPGKYCRSLFFLALMLMAGISARGSQCSISNFTAAWVYSNTSGDSVKFLAVDTSSAARRYWNFGDGSNYASGTDPLHVYSTPGTYQVCLYIYEGSCADTLCSTITVGHPCQTSAAWQYYTTHDSAHFYSSNTSSGVQFYWSFGDGTVGTGATPWHGYAQPGTYHVCLYTSISGSTCRDSFCNNITIASGCHITSTWTYTSVGNDSIHFAGTDTNTSAHHIWNFGDGTSGSGFDNTHVYAQPGTYHVCYYVYIPGTTCSDSTCNTITVASSCPTHISWTYTTHGDTVFFTSSSINTTVHYEWNAGDSTYMSGPTPFHVYGHGGTFYVCLYTYIPGTSCLDSFCNTVSVDTGCNITSAWTYTTSHDSVYFRNVSTNTSAHYYWNFGDGGTGSGYSTSHLYAGPGTYHVCSYVYLPNTNCFDSTCNNVIVTAGCTINAAWQSYTVHDSVHFYSSSQDTTVRRFWNFGDGTQGSGQAPWHGYTQPGTYHVCQYAYIPGTTCSDSFCSNVIVGSGGCRVSAIWTYTTHGDTIYMHSADTISTNHHIWTIGGTSNYLSGSSVSYVFAGPGTYHICLFDYTPNTACSDSSCNNIVITTGCTLNGAWQSYNSTHGDTVHFYAADTASNIYRYWNYGDGSNYGTGSTSSHVYTQPGTYTACLYSFLGNCRDTFCNTVTVGNGCNLTAAWSYTTHGDTVFFTSVDTASAHHHIWNFGVGSNGGSGTSVFYVYPNYGTYHVCLYVYTPGTSCSDSSCNNVTITTPTCQANAAWQFYIVGTDSVHFYAYDTSTSVYFRWNFGDGTYGTNKDPWHTYTQAGTYHVCLYVYTPGTNCIDSFCNNVTIGTGCRLTSAWSYTVYGDSAHFTGVDTTSAAHHIWVFGDGTYSTGFDANHSFAGPGTYHVCYYVYLPGTTCSDSTCNTIIIDTACTLNATWQSYNVNDSVHFYTTDTSSLVHRYWNFGDGSNYGTGTNLWHHYAQPGTYHVCLYAYIPGTNCTDSFCNNVTVGSGCRITGSWSYTTSGDSAHFVGVDTTSAAHHIFSFGDGTYSTSGTSAGHRYPGPGSYHVCYYVYLPGTNCADSSCNTIVIDSGCNVNAAWTSYTVSGDSVRFNAYDTASSLYYSWHFGDGGYGSTHSTGHRYTQPGTYHVCLYVYGQQGTNCIDSFCSTVTVASGCNISSAWSFISYGDSVHFTNTGTNSSAHYIWVYGDGTSGSGYDAGHRYSGPGTYHVCAYVYIPNTNCSDSTCNTIVVDSGCTTNAAWSAYSSGDTVFFFATDTNSTQQLYWRLGDSTYTSGTHPFHVYSHAASYQVCLFAYSGSNCRDTFCNVVTVGNTNLNSSWTYVVNGDTVQFIQNDTNHSAQHFWSYGDGTISANNDTVHAYAAPGTYNVCYYVYIPNSNSYDSTCNTITVSGACSLNTAWYYAPLAGDSFQFTATSRDSSTYLVWSFGDGTSNSGSVVAHSYPVPGIYHVCVQAYVPGTSCTDSLCTDVNTNGITDVGTTQQTIRLVPNPFSQSAIINITGPASAYEAHIYDLVGQLVRTDRSVNNSILIERGSLTSGIYIYTVTANGAVIGTGKMTVE